MSGGGCAEGYISAERTTMGEVWSGQWVGFSPRDAGIGVLLGVLHANSEAIFRCFAGFGSMSLGDCKA